MNLLWSSPKNRPIFGTVCRPRPLTSEAPVLSRERHRVLFPASGAADHRGLPIAGNDTAAKAEVARFMDAVGYDAVDIGRLTDS